MHRTRLFAIALVATVLGALWLVSPVAATGALTGGVGNDTNGGTTSIALHVTVATTEVCGTDESITVNKGDALYFCYSVLNTGTNTLRFHSLNDTAFGEILANVPYDLASHARL